MSMSPPYGTSSPGAPFPPSWTTHKDDPNAVKPHLPGYGVDPNAVPTVPLPGSQPQPPSAPVPAFWSDPMLGIRAVLELFTDVEKQAGSDAALAAARSLQEWVRAERAKL